MPEVITLVLLAWGCSLVLLLLLINQTTLVSSTLVWAARKWLKKSTRTCQPSGADADLHVISGGENGAISCSRPKGSKQN